MRVTYSHHEMCCLHVFQGDYYGVDWDGPAPDVSLDEVPNTTNPLEPAQYSSLTNLINPLRNSDEYGVEIYLEVLTFLQETATSS